MPITRSTWIDDDGTGTTGTIINNAELQKIYNNIDAAIVGGGGLTAKYIILSLTGTQHNVACGAPGLVTYVYCTNAADLTITGFAFTSPARAGDQIIITARGAGQVYLAHLGASSAGNTLGNIATSAHTPLAGLKGRATYVYEAASGIWLLHDHDQGDWISQPYVAGDFTGAPSGGWTVPTPNTFVYWVRGRALTVDFYVANTTITGAPLSLNIKIPGGFSLSRPGGMPFNYAMGTAGIGWAAQEIAGPTLIKLYRDILGTAWSAATCHVSSMLTFPIT